MIKNYLLIAIRYIIRHKAFTLINVSGLTLGICCSLLIFLFIRDEMSYDRFHPDKEHIFRLSLTGGLQGRRINSSRSGFVVGPQLVKEQVGWRAYLRLVDWQTFPIRYENTTFTEQYLLLADPNFFRFFSFELVEGHPDSVLDAPGKMVISESAARRYFNYTGKGDRSPLGKTMVLAQGYKAKVSGIATDPPRNSHFHFTHVLSLSSWKEAGGSSGWTSRDVHTYLKREPQAQADKLLQACNRSLEKNTAIELEALGLSAEDFKKQGNELKFDLQPLTDIHLHSDLEDEIEANGRIEHVYIFASVAFFITLLACINFMNLFTARSTGRAREVAIRKTAGAQNARLIGQFMLESYLYVGVSALFSVLLVLVMLGPFNFFTGKDIAFSDLLDGRFVAGGALFILITGLLASSYPAFYLTRFSPVEVMRGRLRATLRSYGIRNLLVVFQFFVGTSLIISTFVVLLQLFFFNHVDIGFDRKNVINLLHTRNLGNQGIAFKEQLKTIPGVVGAGYASRLPPFVDWQAMVRPEGSTKDFLVGVYEMDEDHFQAMGYQLSAGRLFSARHPEDSGTVLLNETAVRLMEMEQPIGKTIFSYYDTPDARRRKIVGIVKDFNFQSLKEKLMPLAIIPGDEPNWEMAIRTTGENPDSVITAIGSLFREASGGAPFEFSYLDQNFASKHIAEKRVAWLFVIFTFLAIVIACLGLLGLATFSIEHRVKEIGIRKVLGASLGNIMVLLNKDFLKLVVMANLIAWPVAGWLMTRWLDQFAYRINISWYVFAVAFVLTTVIALLAVSIQAGKAASANPVHSLRNE